MRLQIIIGVNSKKPFFLSFFAAIQNNEAVKLLSKMILTFLIFSITGYNALPPNDMEATMTHLANVVSTINNITNMVSKQNSTNDQ